MRHLILLLTALTVISGCAKNRGIDERKYNDTKDWQDKTTYTGTGAERELFYSKITVVQNSLDGGFLFSGFQSDMRVGYFDFTEDKMIFKSIQGPYIGRETGANSAPVLFQWPVKHRQNKLNVVDGKTTNKEVEDDVLKWHQKRYIEVDLSKPDVSEEDSMTGKSECWPVASRRRVDDSVQLEPGYISFVVEVVYNRACLTSYETIHNGFTQYTVQYRYSFYKKDLNNDYQPFLYQGELDPKMRKFGYFQSIKEELNPADGRPRNIFFINRWNPNKTHHFYFTKSTSDQYKYLFYDIFEKTNKIFESAKIPMRVEIHENTWGDGKVKELGDLRYAFVNIVDTIDPSAPLGYGPSDADPLTGEIISSTLNIWSSSLKDYIRRIKMSSDRIPTKWEESTLYKKMAEVLEKPPATWATEWSPEDKRAQFFQHMTKETTYTYPMWNAYTYHDGMLPTQVYVDKIGHGDTSGDDMISSLTSVIKTHKLTDPKLIASFYNPKNDTLNAFSEPKMINYHAIEETPLFKTLASLNSVSGDISSEKMLGSLTEAMEKHQKDSIKNVSDNIRGHCKMDMDAALGGIEPLIIQGFSPEEIAENIMYRTAIHEFGHNLNLRHNFYGSNDEENFPAPSVPKFTVDAEGKKVPEMGADGKQAMWPGVSSSVMDYLRLQDDFFTEKNWEPYDIAAIKYAYTGGKSDDGKLYLFCTDEHTLTNAICNRFDRGSTPTQIVTSIIDAYEDGYYTRNYRDGRAYWNTWGYNSSILATMQQLKEFLPMWRAAFYEANMRSELKKKGYTKDEGEEMVEVMNRELIDSIKLTLAFYQSVLQQSASDKPYRSEYEKGTSSLERMGIGFDKLAAMYFMAGDDALYYNPNLILLNSSYMTYATSSYPELAVMMEKILENIVTVRVDMEPWFIGFGRQLYAQSAMDYSNRDDQSFIRKIKIKRYNAYEIEQYFNYDLGNLDNASATANMVTLTQSKDADFKVGEEVGIVRSNSHYYVFSKQKNPYAYDIYKDIKSAEEGDRPATDGQMDIQELYYIYSFSTTGTI